MSDGVLIAGHSCAWQSKSMPYSIYNYSYRYTFIWPQILATNQSHIGFRVYFKFNCLRGN